MPGPFGFQGACDLVHFRGIGAQGTVIGPGDLAMAHKPDEFVPVDEFIAASLIYRDIATTMLASGRS
jgi:acetylornithine deacetylase/succinyl-diaminopimelate desuccinylase